MKYISKSILAVMVPALFGWTSLQKEQQIFLTVVDGKGQLIRGTSLERGFERQIIVTAFSGVTTGNAVVKFSMPSGAASAGFSNMQGNKQKLPYAVFTLTEPGVSRLDVTTTIRLESISIVRVEDVNGSTNVTLQSARMGTTYFQQDRKTGARTISGKTGYDYTTGQTWNSF